MEDQPAFEDLSVSITVMTIHKAMADEGLDVIKGWTKALDPGVNVTQDEVDKILRGLLAGYVATTDAPAIFFVEELVRLYPEAKVVCVIREPARWWESYQELINTLDNPLSILLQLVQPTLRYSLAWKLAILKRRRKIYPPEFEPLGPRKLLYFLLF